MEMEDDVFLADLSEQIALLITEDDEDDSTSQELPTHYFPTPIQGCAHFPKMIMASSYAYEFSFTRECRGTGIFIPKSSLTGRKSKPRKPHSTVTNYQTNQLNRKESAISEISNTNEFKHNTNHRYYNKSGWFKSLMDRKSI